MVPPIRALIELHGVEGEPVLVAGIPETRPEEEPRYYSGAGLTNGAFVPVADGDRRRYLLPEGLDLVRPATDDFQVAAGIVWVGPRPGDRARGPGPRASAKHPRKVEDSSCLQGGAP
jgi:hypothetical protein